MWDLDSDSDLKMAFSEPAITTFCLFYLKNSLTTGTFPGCHTQGYCNCNPLAVSCCPHGRSVNESNQVEKQEKVLHVCSHFPLAQFPHLPHSISLCWQIKIHGLPSHPFVLHCLIVSKIEDITGHNLWKNKNLPETWQCIQRHTFNGWMW